MFKFRETSNAKQITELVKLYKKGRKYRTEVLDKLLYIPMEEATNFYEYLNQQEALLGTLIELEDFESIAYMGLVKAISQAGKVCFEGTLRDACMKEMKAEFKKLKEDEKFSATFENECRTYHVDKETYIQEYLADPRINYDVEAEA